VLIEFVFEKKIKIFKKLQVSVKLLTALYDCDENGISSHTVSLSIQVFESEVQVHVNLFVIMLNKKHAEGREFEVFRVGFCSMVLLWIVVEEPKNHFRTSFSLAKQSLSLIPPLESVLKLPTFYLSAERDLILFLVL
jgi:hypothetical protein